jgi:hypothetical protein
VTLVLRPFLSKATLRPCYARTKLLISARASFNGQILGTEILAFPEVVQHTTGRLGRRTVVFEAEGRLDFRLSLTLSIAERASSLAPDMLDEAEESLVEDDGWQCGWFKGKR